MQLNMGLVYLVFPVAGGLMVLESLAEVLKRAQRPDTS
jgi:TRAP-type C4-dicarboxylate transport system permease small subunit